MDAILIVDGESAIRQQLNIILSQGGYLCRLAEDSTAAKHVLTEHRLELMLIDLDLPEKDALPFIEHCKNHYPEMAIMVMGVEFADDQTAQVVGMGVYGFLLKPLHPQLVLVNISNTLRLHRSDLQDQYITKILEREIAARTHKLDEQLRFFQTLLDSIPVPIYYKDKECHYLGINHAFEQVFHLKKEEVVGKATHEVHPSEIAADLHGKDLELLRDGGSQTYERLRVYKDGTKKTALINKATFNDSQGAVAGFVGIGIDISELKQVEASLRQSEQALRTIIDNVQIGIFLIDAKLIIRQCNSKAMEWFPEIDTDGTPHSCARIFRECAHNLDISCQQEVFEQAKIFEQLITAQTAAGQKIIRLVINPIVQESQSPQAAVVLMEDITEKLSMERELHQAQKLEAIGQLAAGIAHEINTPVQYIGDNLRFLDESCNEILAICTTLQQFIQDTPDDRLPETVAQARQILQEHDLEFLTEEIPQTIAQSKEGVSRVGTIVRAMREFSHPGSEEKVLVDINRALDSTLTVSRNEWKYVAEVQTDFSPDLPMPRCLPGEINQVFLNLIVNAAHAIGDVVGNGGQQRGLIRVSTRSDDGWIEIRIADSGGGIPEAIQDRIFDPFFTTKKVGVGTGQGLAIARSVVVDKHQGSLRFTTKAGGGTTFIIRLPLL